MNVLNKILLILILAIVSNASTLHDSIRNIIGENKYQHHKYMILNEFKNEQNFYIGNTLKYKSILKILKDKGLLHLKYDMPQTVHLEFQTNSSSVKMLKIIKDILANMGYTYYYTDFIKRENTLTQWKINFKSETMLDPFIFVEELRKLEVDILNIEKIDDYNWKYEFDLNYANISNTVMVLKDEKISLKKPHTAYMLSVNDVISLKIVSARLNSWYPRISFYDKDLKLLSFVEKTTVHKAVLLDVPNMTKYISIDDTYTLLNIKRGLTVLVR